jgi:uracil-DNA glycosylase
MNPQTYVQCVDFPCPDVNHSGYLLPDIEVNPQKIKVMMIAEAAPPQATDYFYAPGDPLFQRTTVLAFNDAGFPVTSIQEIIDLGVYLTTAVKCSKTGYGIQAGTIDACSHLLEVELSLFPAVETYLLMGDVAIQAINHIARRDGTGRAIPAGSTYKIRGGEFYFRGKRAFPSYLQAGPSFFIEKSKRQMIAEDIVSAMRVSSK